MTVLHGVAILMSGCPSTEDGMAIPLASWYHLTPVDPGSAEYVVVTNHGVYQSDSLGHVHDFFCCLYERAAVGTPADALAHIGFEVQP